MSADIPVDQPRNRLSFAEMLERMETMTDAQAQPLLDAIKARLPELETLLKKGSLKSKNPLPGPRTPCSSSTGLAFKLNRANGEASDVFKPVRHRLDPQNWKI